MTEPVLSGPTVQGLPFFVVPWQWRLVSDIASSGSSGVAPGVAGSGCAEVPCAHGLRDPWRGRGRRRCLGARLEAALAGAGVAPGAGWREAWAGGDDAQA